MTEFFKSKIVKTILQLAVLIGVVYAVAEVVANTSKQIEINELTKGLENQKELNISLGDSIKTKDSIINALKKQSTQKTSSIDCEKKVLIVYNNTDKMRFFSYTHIESGKGSGYPISPKSNLVKELE